MPYLDDLDTRDMGDGDALLLGRFRYQVPDTGEIKTAEKGFITDFASIPRLFRMLVTGNDNTKKPAVIHDKGYRGRRLHGTLRDKYKARKREDQIMLMGMEENGVPWWKRRLVYRGVRMGGSFAWVGKVVDVATK
ncbi:MAG: DUF1353 domain-containing protein [Desulfuromonadales bacterium]|nr:DUF1353 domain-containing protein [Desulfuromonadales bacterium]